ncbi:hypothetical protein GBZ48_28260 [Azospirillum melinis]|uniref:DUF385 domain-containing protein n=1 Tax=Azospirillum melinis TaxID=328839 RepID=A0ABX2KR98_9PROT|nr:hypothetical protein [Azospirillum melinis]MBP2309754.1 hypothetical protein [Azospirillum melinis]NUB03127.1 hypothetical protein [Azospirillum melinis]
MRVSKWQAILRGSYARDLVFAAFLLGGWYQLDLPWPYLLVAAILLIVVPVVFQLPGNWPRRMTAEKWDEVLRGPVVHFTTPERAMEMARGGSSKEGRMPGWVHVRPSSGRKDSVGLKGRKAAYAFAGFPTRGDWVRNVGKHATVAVVIDPSTLDLRDVRYRTADGAVMLLDGYHGPAELVEVRPDPTDERVRLTAGKALGAVPATE